MGTESAYATNSDILELSGALMDRHQHLQPRSGGGSSSNSRSSSRNRGCVMSISCLTWASDSHGLFDYESRNVFKKNFKIQCLRK